MKPNTSSLVELAMSSVDVIASNQDVGGAYIASPAFPVYRYSWFRDGAFIADAMSRAGAIDSADRFFGWCSRVLVDRREHIGNLIARSRRGESIQRDEHLPTRYTLAGDLTGEDWEDFQLDGYGAWMWALGQHAQRHGIDVSAHAEAIELSVTYLCEFWHQPCYDWWEEHVDDRHPSTWGAILAGLRAASTTGLLDPAVDAMCASASVAIYSRLRTDAVVNGHLAKSLGRSDVDASLISCLTPFGVVDAESPLGVATYEAILRDLAPDGVHRYLTDTYFGGGRWVVLAGFVGWHEAVTGRRDRALARLQWMHAQATPACALPEQVVEHALHPAWIATWEAKWGPVATPLLWSHAMYISLAHALGLLDGQPS